MTSAFGDQKVPMMTQASNVGEGWHQIIRDLEEKLNEIDPDFELLQVKEKFGMLRYYAVQSGGQRTHEFHDLIDAAEDESGKTCELCGKPGETRGPNWLKTLCDQHHAEREAS